MSSKPKPVAEKTYAEKWADYEDALERWGKECPDEGPPQPPVFSIRPIRTRVIVKRVEPMTKYKHIHIPDTAGEKPQEGIVVAVGPGDWICNKEAHTIVPVGVHVGERVMFGKYGGIEFDWEDTKYIALLEDDIIMVLPQTGNLAVRMK